MTPQMIVKNNPGYKTFLNSFISFLTNKRYKRTTANTAISPIGINGYVIIKLYYKMRYTLYFSDHRIIESSNHPTLPIPFPQLNDQHQNKYPLPITHNEYLQ